MRPDNVVLLTGRLGKDVELRYTNSGKAVANFSLATQQNKDAETEWHQITAWEKTAETCAQYLGKGDTVSIAGRLGYRTWEKDGTKRREAVITATGVQFLITKRSQGPKEEAAPPHQNDHPIASSSQWSQPSSGPAGNYAQNTMDDIPF